MAEAEATHWPASQVLRELMREFVVERQRRACDQDAFFSSKVEALRAVSIRAGSGRCNGELEANFPMTSRPDRKDT